MRILIVRHAEPDYERDCLTEKGRRQAALLGRRLARIPARAYYVSPLGRARETAEYTLRLVGREAETLPWLAEFRGRVPDPQREGASRVPWDFRAEQWNGHEKLFDRERWTEDPLMQGGSVEEIWKETVRGADSLLASHGCRRKGCVYRCGANSDDTLVLFCHFGIGMAVMAHLTGLPVVPLWQSHLFLPSSVTTLITQERVKGEVEFRCLCAGDVSHLLAQPELLSLAGLFPECYNGVESTDPGRWPALPEKPALG